jgi:uncharacterized protein (TIGR00288 family)
MSATDQGLTSGRQVGVFVDWENLVAGAGKGLPKQTNTVPYEALTRLSRDYGNAVIRKAYADWGQYTRFHENLAMNGVDMIQVPKIGASAKNAADIRMTVDAMETIFAHPAVEVFVLVTGDSDYSPLVRRLREYGKWVVGVGTEANASRLLVSVCSEYKFWGTLVAEVDPAAGPVVRAAFNIDKARSLLLRAFEEIAADTPTAGTLKNKMLILDPSFDEHNYGCKNFRDFLGRFPEHVKRVGKSGADITLTLTTKIAPGSQ